MPSLRSGRGRGLESVATVKEWYLTKHHGHSTEDFYTSKMEMLVRPDGL